MYDLKADPGELKNLFGTRRLRNVRYRLEALLAVLAICKTDSCRNPWQVTPTDLAARRAQLGTQPCSAGGT